MIKVVETRGDQASIQQHVKRYDNKLEVFYFIEQESIDIFRIRGEPLATQHL